MQFRLTVLLTLALIYLAVEAAPHNELVGRSPQRFRKAAAARASAAAAAKASSAAAAKATAKAGGNAGSKGQGSGQQAAASKSSQAAAATATQAAASKGGAQGANAAASGAAAGAAAGAASGAAASGANNGGNGNQGAASNEDPQKSLTLDPRVIAPGFANDGQDVPTAGQVASITSTNNFINFCLTVNKPITNGQQIQGGSCNPAPIGVIPNVNTMPSAKFQFPPNFGTIKANTAFTIKMAIKNLQTGAFTNAQQTYFAAPQQLNGQGVIIGHSHVTIDPVASLTDPNPTDPTKFAFFKGLNAAAQGGILTADVDKGLPAGVYRLASINSAANHQPVIVPVAQHGSLDDAIYFTVTEDGQPAGGAAANNGGNQAAGGAAAGGSGAAAGAATGKNNNNNNNNKGK